MRSAADINVRGLKLLEFEIDPKVSSSDPIYLAMNYDCPHADRLPSGFCGAEFYVLLCPCIDVLKIRVRGHIDLGR